MKAFITLVFILVAAAAIYFLFVKDSAPYTAYKSFAGALANGDRNRALQYASGSEVLGEEQENRRLTAGGMPVEALVAIRYTRESETKNPDGTVTVRALQSVRFDPPGATSAMGAMTAKYRQAATLQKSQNRWLVSSFQSEFIEMRNWKGEKQ